MHASGLHQTVLVVDDEHDIAQSIRDTIEAYLDGVRTVAAASGPEGLEVLRREPVDLILSDHRMPGMTGLQFLRAARHAAPTVPRILVTAHPDLDVAVCALNEEHVVNFLPKPIDGGVLVEVVAASLHERLAEVGRMRSIAKALGRMRADAGGGASRLRSGTG